MNFYEHEIVILEKRIKKIEENPVDSRLKSNKIYYELQRDFRKELNNAWQAGKPFARDLPGVQRLVKSMGFHPVDTLPRAGQTMDEARENLKNIRGRGFPAMACEICLLSTRVSLSGSIPVPNLAIRNIGCDPAVLSCSSVENFLNIPSYHLDLPLGMNEDSLRYVTTQLEEFIEFAESKIPGIKYNEDILIELQDYDKRADVYYKELYEIRKRVPCPLPARDAFRPPIRPSSYYPNHAKALEFVKAYHDEVCERAEKGVSTVTEEKLRVMWTVTIPVFRNPFNKWEKMGVAIPMLMNAMEAFVSSDSLKLLIKDREPTPLEGEAKEIIGTLWGQPGSKYVDAILNACRDMKVDAIVNFLQQGCTPSLCLKKQLADRAEKELGLPTLQIEGAIRDPDYVNAEEFDKKVEEFMMMCIARKAAN